MKNECKICMTCKYYKVIELHGVLQSEICTYGTDDGDYSECDRVSGQECSRFYAVLMQAVMKRMRTSQFSLVVGSRLSIPLAVQRS